MTSHRKSANIYDYPEHLNPFYEGDNHNRIRFWNITKRKSRSNSFSFQSIKDFKNTLGRSFSIRKKHHNIDRSSGSVNEETEYETHTPQTHRQTLPVQSVQIQQESVTPLPRMRFHERVRNADVRKDEPTGTIPRSTSLNIPRNTNPFDENGDKKERASTSTPSPGIRRKKKRAPPPPPVRQSSLPKTNEEKTDGSDEKSETGSIEIKEEVAEILQEFKEYNELNAEIETYNSESSNVTEKHDVEVSIEIPEIRIESEEDDNESSSKDETCDKETNNNIPDIEETAEDLEQLKEEHKETTFEEPIENIKESTETLEEFVNSTEKSVESTEKSVESPEKSVEPTEKSVESTENIQITGMVESDGCNSINEEKIMETEIKENIDETSDDTVSTENVEGNPEINYNSEVHVPISQSTVSSESELELRQQEQAIQDTSDLLEMVQKLQMEVEKLTDDTNNNKISSTCDYKYTNNEDLSSSKVNDSLNENNDDDDVICSVSTSPRLVKLKKDNDWIKTYNY